jgi:hypothetical protein
LGVEHKDPSTVDWDGLKNEIYQVAEEKKSRKKAKKADVIELFGGQEEIREEALVS